MQGLRVFTLINEVRHPYSNMIGVMYRVKGRDGGKAGQNAGEPGEGSGKPRADRGSGVALVSRERLRRRGSRRDHARRRSHAWRILWTFRIEGRSRRRSGDTRGWTQYGKARLLRYPRRSRGQKLKGTTLCGPREWLRYRSLRCRYCSPKQRRSPRPDDVCACAARPFHSPAQIRRSGEAPQARHRDARRNGGGADARAGRRRSRLIERDPRCRARRFCRGAAAGLGQWPLRSMAFAISNLPAQI